MKSPRRVEVSRQVLEQIGAYATGELSGEEASRIERFVRKNEAARRLAEDFLMMLAHLRSIHEGSPEPPKEIVERTIARVVEEAGQAPHEDESANNPRQRAVSCARRQRRPRRGR
jgi:anti-sigma factor RsiW